MLILRLVPIPACFQTRNKVLNACRASLILLDTSCPCFAFEPTRAPKYTTEEASGTCDTSMKQMAVSVVENKLTLTKTEVQVVFRRFPLDQMKKTLEVLAVSGNTSRIISELHIKEGNGRCNSQKIFIYE